MFSVFPIFSFNDIIIHFTEFSNKCQTNHVCFIVYFYQLFLILFLLLDGLALRFSLLALTSITRDLENV